MRHKTWLANKISRSFFEIKELISFQESMGMDDPFSDGEFVTFGSVFELFRDVNHGNLWNEIREVHGLK